jgi:quercetin dioxygenase-like cupin family protein
MFGCQHFETKEEMKPMKQSVIRKDLLTAVIDESRSISKVEIQEIIMNVGVDAPLHLHPCPTMGIVMEGKIAFEIEGEETQHFKQGDAFYEPADVRVSKFNNEGDAPAKFVAFYLLGENDTETIQMLDR